jgi:hypothetical protein
VDSREGFRTHSTQDLSTLASVVDAETTPASMMNHGGESTRFLFSKRLRAEAGLANPVTIGN